MVDYYRRRAGEYEAFYAKPERQADLLLLKKKIAEILKRARVLEIACGTGYWTTVIASAAESVTATDPDFLRVSDEDIDKAIAEIKAALRKNVPPRR